MLFVLLVTIHVLVCLFLIGVVLLQSGKAADLAGAFGGMGSQTAFGPRGSATLLSKLTTGSAVMFMVTSLSLSIIETRESGGAGSSVLDKTGATQSAPAKKSAPASTPTPPGVPAGQPLSQPAQPSVTLMDESTGEKKTLPLNIPPAEQAPPQGKQAPAPAKK